MTTVGPRLYLVEMWFSTTLGYKLSYKQQYLCTIVPYKEAAILSTHEPDP